MRRILKILLATLAIFLASCAPTATTIEPLPPVAEYEPSAADLERYRNELARYTDDWGLVDPPDHEIVRWINPEDTNTVRPQCLTALGIEVVHTEDSYYTTTHQDQMESYYLAEYQCMAQYPVRQDIYRPPDHAEIDMIYEHIEDTYIPCLDQAGYPGVTMPTKQRFREAIETTGALPGELHQQLQELYPGMGMDDWEALSALCPMMPPGFRSYEA